MDCIVDLETFSTDSNAAIMVIAAIKFNRNKKIENMDSAETFYRRITLDSCEMYHRHIDDKTIDWWNNQPQEAKKEIFDSNNRIDLKIALQEFKDWFKGCKFIWGHGSSFDCVILENSFKACNIDLPWKFYNVRDTRTLYDIADVKMFDLPSNNKHHALHDCFRELIGIYMSLEKLNKI